MVFHYQNNWKKLHFTLYLITRFSLLASSVCHHLSLWIFCVYQEKVGDRNVMWQEDSSTTKTKYICSCILLKVFIWTYGKFLVCKILWTSYLSTVLSFWANFDKWPKHSQYTNFKQFFKSMIKYKEGSFIYFTSLSRLYRAYITTESFMGRGNQYIQ